MNPSTCLRFSVLLAILFLGLSAPTWAQGGPEGHRIEVSIPNYTGEIACMAYYFGDKQYIRDTVPITQGAFVFEADTNLPAGMYLVFFPPQNDYFEIVVDKDQNFQLETDTSDFVSNMKVKGSKENTRFYEDLQFLASKRKEAEELQKQMREVEDPEVLAQLKRTHEGIAEEVMDQRLQLVNENPDFLYAKMIKGMQEPQIPEAPKDENGQLLDSTFAFNYYKAHFFDGLDLNDDRMLRTSVLFNRVQLYMDRLTYTYQPDSVIQSIDYILSLMKESKSNFRFFLSHFYNSYSKSPIMGMDAVPVHLGLTYYRYPEITPWIPDSTRRKMLSQILPKARVLVGNQAPNLKLTDDQGKEQILSQIESEWTIVYFWDYGCGFCKKVTPKLAEAFTKYQLAEKGVTLLTINTNGDVEEWRKKLVDYNLDFEGAIHTEDIYERSRAQALYDVLAVPRIFVLDKDKNIVAKQIGVPQMLEIFSRAIDFELEEEDKVVDQEEEDK
ncbi:MAG: redoxin domain-containing protein [Bacteroidota bacterium]